MLDKIKTDFSIVDLQNLTGISVHNIRIWERRFGLLNPDRTVSNIRIYNTSHLKKLLNISVLYQNGYKISQLAAFSDQQLIKKLDEFTVEANGYMSSIKSFKLAMLHFDRFLFEETYAKLAARLSFSDLFMKVIIPLLEETGRLWQTNSITPAQEHFISNLIRQKLFLNIEKNSSRKNTDPGLYVLFLPMEEIHELGLLFVHYSLLLAGKHAIYLGQSVATENLLQVRQTYAGTITYISYFTVYPQGKSLHPFFTTFKNTVLSNSKKDQLWVAGRKLRTIKNKKKIAGITLFEETEKLLDTIKALKK